MTAAVDATTAGLDDPDLADGRRRGAARLLQPGRRVAAQRHRPADLGARVADRRAARTHSDTNVDHLVAHRSKRRA